MNFVKERRGQRGLICTSYGNGNFICKSLQVEGVIYLKQGLHAKFLQVLLLFFFLSFLNDEN